MITKWEQHGLKLTEDASFLTVLQAAYVDGGFAVQSNFARRFAVDVAMAASLGCVSTCTGLGNKGYGRVWYVTAKGLTILKHAKNADEASQLLNS